MNPVMSNSTHSSLSLQEILKPISKGLSEMESFIERLIRSREELMGEIVNHVRSFRGKRLRPSLVYFGALCVSETADQEEEIVTLASITELIHTVTLIHDDIIDRADTRRNASTFNRKWDNQVAVIFGDYLFSKAFSMTVSLSDQRVREYIAEVTSDLCEGEIKQLHGRNNVMMSEEVYFDMILLKTATFLGCCTGMGARLAGASGETVEILERVGRFLGCAFQIVDDCLDIMGSESEMGKSLGTDVATGKFTLPLIKLIQHLTPGQVEDIKSLFQAGEGYKAKDMIFSLARSTGSIDEAWEEARRFTAEATRDLENLPPSLGRDGLIHLANYLISRSH
jgi:octaprenyl-diphosphate synthase